MNLVDLLDEGGLKQDEWSLTAPTFGKEGQLTVVGWSGKSGSKKFYILKCVKCSQDNELLGEGYFKSVAASLRKGHLPCACSSKPQWSSFQYTLLCERKSSALGHTFLGFDGKISGQHTRLKMHCDHHGIWTTGTINGLLNMSNGCPSCKPLLISEANTKPDAIMIESFFNTNCFHSDTKFWRSDRKDSRGCKNYWIMQCPECGEKGEALTGDFQKGNRSCGCSPHRQKEAYINCLLDNSVAVGIKFGIAKNSVLRAKQQDTASIYDIQNISVFKFTTVEDCKAAERECKRELQTGVISKVELLDGYTETTYIHNLDKIKQIYKKHGGVEI